MWAPISAYLDNYEDDTFDRLRLDVVHLNSWRHSAGMPPLSVNWNAVCVETNSILKP